jgi:soluble cytochrome b562
MRSSLAIPFFAFLLSVALGQAVQADTPLEKQMNQMRRSFKELKKAMEAPVEADKPKYLGWVADLKKAAEESKTLEPEKTEKVPVDEQKAFLEGYRSKMEEMIGQIDQLGQAIEAGKWAEAKSLIGQINQRQREGHGKYRSDSH